MARPLTLLLAGLACVASARLARAAPPPRYNGPESLQPFDFYSDYDSYEPVSMKPPPPRTPLPIARYTTPSNKVIIRTNNRPKVNATVKNSRNPNKNQKKVIKTTTINIESHTNLIVTEKPQRYHNGEGRPVRYRRRPVVPVEPEYVWVEENYEEVGTTTEELVVVTKAPVRRRPAPVRRRPSPVKRPVVKQLPATTARPPTTRRTTTKKPHKATKPQKLENKLTTCPPKKTAFLTSFFEDKKKKKPPKKKNQKPGWVVGVFSGFFNKMYKWIWGPSKGQSSGSWFGGSWFEGEVKKTSKSPPTTTTLAPFATTPDWFQNLIQSEEDDAYVNLETKKPHKKPLRKSYKGFQLLRAYPDVQWKVHEMMDLQQEADGSGVMWWTQPSINGSTDLLVPPDLLPDIKDHFKSNKIDFDVIIWDLHKAIMYENPKLSKKQRLELEQLRGHPMTWRRYHRYADMLRYLEYLQHSHSDIVELLPLGRSSEGLPLVVVKVSLPSNHSLSREEKKEKKRWRLKSSLKPAVWIDAGSHAREWISPASAMWMLHALVEGDKGLDAEHEQLRQADFFIMPVVNPDGYEHSHTHDRLWRKTRSRHGDKADDFMSWMPWNWGTSDCVGVDPDRNYDYHWGEQHASRDPCSDYYAGPHPFSEPETRAVSAFLTEHKHQMKVFISLHSYSQAWLIPSSHAHAPFSDDGVLMEMGKLATAALADLYGTKYQVGTAAEIRQPASGMAHDWAKARAGVKFAYHVDLRDSFGPYGFLLPGSQIVATAKETWQAVKAIVDNITPG